MSGPRTYFAIDLKSYYASAECAARGLDPLTTNLVVADASRTEKDHLLAVSPSLKALGIPGRGAAVRGGAEGERRQRRPAAGGHPQPRRCEKGGQVVSVRPSYDAKALAADPSLKSVTWWPRPGWAYYEKVSRQIYGIYLKYVAPEDMVVYSIDEVFIDATPYLAYYNMAPHDLAKTMIREVLYHHRHHRYGGHWLQPLPGQAGYGHYRQARRSDKDGVRIAELDEESFRYLLWDTSP